MTIRQYVSQLFGFRIKDGIGGWDDFTQNMEKSGTWSITGSPRKFQAIIIELLKRVERLEYERDEKPYEVKPPDAPLADTRPGGTGENVTVQSTDK